MVVFALKSAVASAFLALACALTSTLDPVTFDFGPNPTNIQMSTYRPSYLATPTPLIVAMHYCTGTAELYFSGTNLAALADQHGFIVLYPTAPAVGGCWDVNTNETLTHNGGGDSLGIVSMVRYLIANWGIDSSRVFATGTSSGAMMTSVLMGAYPDVFAAGSLYSGVPYGCFAGPNAWNSQCSTGELILTPQQWGDQVRNGYPGFIGIRPKIQFWHGTADTALYPQNFWEEIKQWTNVFGVSPTPSSNISGDPEYGYSRASFGPRIQAILAQGVGHTIPEHETDTLDWFGLSSLTQGATASVSLVSTAPSTTTVPQWGQ